MRFRVALQPEGLPLVALVALSLGLKPARAVPHESLCQRLPPRRLTDDETMENIAAGVRRSSLVADRGG
jgi:hypothetical protein